jgi:uncharacterized OsmC-like protein
MHFNNVNLAEIEKFVSQAQQDAQVLIKRKKVTGEWNFVDGQAQFKAQLEYQKGTSIIQADQATFLGGSGIMPDPIQYCLFGTCACFAGTYATVAATKQIALTMLRISAENEVDLSLPMGIATRPIVRKVHITVEVESPADETVLKEIEKLALERCPGIYCMVNPIPITAELKKI